MSKFRYPRKYPQEKGMSTDKKSRIRTVVSLFSLIFQGVLDNLELGYLVFWRRHPDLNRRMEVLQTSALPLGYAAPLHEEGMCRGDRPVLSMISPCGKKSPPGGGWSGRRDLNPRLQPWQGCTLPLSYSRSWRKALLNGAGRDVKRDSEPKEHPLAGRIILYL